MEILGNESVRVGDIFKTTNAYKLLTLFLASVLNVSVFEDDFSRRKNCGKDTIFLPLPCNFQQSYDKR
jgi:hypothetical protein